MKHYRFLKFLYIILIFILLTLHETAFSKDLIVGINDLPINFNPFMQKKYIEKIISSLVYASIVSKKGKFNDPIYSYEPYLAESVQADSQKQGQMNISLHNVIPIHNSKKHLGYEDFLYTIKGINFLKDHPYHINQMEVKKQDKRNLNIIINHPKVAPKKGEKLRKYLTFPIVAKGYINNYTDSINSNNSLKAIKGAGPYELSSFETKTNKIFLTRFFQFLGKKYVKNDSIRKLAFYYRDINTDLYNAFQTGVVHILLNNVSFQLPEYSSNIIYNDDVSLNSVTCLAFNFKRNKYYDLISDQRFRDLVASCMNKDVREVFKGIYPGKIMYLLDEPHSKQKICYHDLMDPSKREEKIKNLFNDEKIKKMLEHTGKPIEIEVYYEDYLETISILADKVIKSLEIFHDFIIFKEKPVSTNKTWDEIVHNKKFTIMIYTHYFGANREIMNTNFFSGNENFNLTGYKINPFNKDGDLDYDKFLIEVNSKLPVIALGQFIRYNLINMKNLRTSGQTSYDQNEEKEFKNSSIFYGVWDWRWSKIRGRYSRKK